MLDTDGWINRCKIKQQEVQAAKEVQEVQEGEVVSDHHLRIV